VKKQIIQLEYSGFESVYDLDRDINEMWSKPEFKEIPDEFQGKIIITIEYDAMKKAQKFNVDGWEVSNYFGAQGSFFSRDDKEWARTHRFKYLNDKEFKQYQKANPPKRFTL
jgi:hypothetical protein